MEKQQKIKDLYFNKNYTQTQIAKELNVSNQYVSKILKKESKYLEVKEQRKQINQRKNIQETKDYNKTKRKNAQFRNSADDLILKNMHNQASMELSQPKRLSNMAYRNWNKSAYSYNEKKKRFELKKEIGRSADVPKYIKMEVL